MRVEIDDWMARRHTIDSADPRLIGQWFAEKSRLLISANAALGPLRMHIWPSDQAENDLIGAQEVYLTQDSLLELVQHLLDASAMLGEKEADGEHA